MSRIAPLHRRDAGPFTRLLLALARRKAAQAAGSNPAGAIEPVEVLARTPALLLGYGGLELGFERSRHVDRRLKELVVLKAATLVECEYCIDIGSAVARRTGLRDEELLALARHRESKLFVEREKLALDLAAAATRTPSAVTDELVQALRAHFDDAQIVELAAAAALENFRARLNAALGIGAAGFSEGRVCAVPGGAVSDRALPDGATPRVAAPDSATPDGPAPAPAALR